MRRGYGHTFSRHRRVAPEPPPPPPPRAPTPPPRIRFTEAEVRRLAPPGWLPQAPYTSRDYVKRLRTAVDTGMSPTDIFLEYLWEPPPPPVKTAKELEDEKEARDYIRIVMNRRFSGADSVFKDAIKQRIQFSGRPGVDEYGDADDKAKFYKVPYEEYGEGYKGEGAPSRFPASVKATIDKYGDWVINSIMVKRHGIPHYIQQALNALATPPYDKMFHLAIIVDLRNPSGGAVNIQIDKHATIYVGRPKERKADDERIRVATPNPPTTLHEFLERGLESMGPERFFRYSAFTTNCQDFVSGLLTANNVNDANVNDFVLQDTTSILEQLPDWVEPVTQAITDTQAEVDMLGTGAPIRYAHLGRDWFG